MPDSLLDGLCPCEEGTTAIGSTIARNIITSIEPLAPLPCQYRLGVIQKPQGARMLLLLRLPDLTGVCRFWFTF